MADYEGTANIPAEVARQIADVEDLYAEELYSAAPSD